MTTTLTVVQVAALKDLAVEADIEVIVCDTAADAKLAKL